MRFFTSTGPRRSGVQRYRKAIPFATVLPALDLSHVRDRARQRRCDHGRSLRDRAGARRTFHRRRHARRARRHRRAEAARRRRPAHRGRRRCRHHDLQHDVGGRGRRSSPSSRSSGSAPPTCCATTPGILGLGDAWRDPMELWERVIGVNLYGVIHGIRVVPADHGTAGPRPHRQHRVDGRPHRRARAPPRTP